MKSTDFLADLPTDVIALLSLAILVWGGIAIRTGQRRQDEKLTAVHEQVANDHPTQPNLRDDIDYLKGLMEGVVPWRGIVTARLEAIATDLAATRGELHDERVRSTTRDDLLDRSIRDEVARAVMRENQIEQGRGSGE